MDKSLRETIKGCLGMVSVPAAAVTRPMEQDDDDDKPDFLSRKKYRRKYRGKFMDKHSAPTSSQLAVKDQSSVAKEAVVGSFAETQASSLIDLVLSGQDPNELMHGAISEIREGEGGGPFHIGSKVKLNKAWSGTSVEGKSVSLKAGDVVSIVMPNLGEHGQDKMVLLDDGIGRVIVPLDVLGESIGVGPSGHAVPDAKGSPGSLIQQQAVGQSEPKSPAEKKGATSALSHPSASQVAAAPKDAPGAQKKGASAPSSQQSVAVEAIEDILSKLEEMKNEGDDSTYRRIDTLINVLEAADDIGAWCEIYEMMFGEGDHSFDDIDALFEEDDSMPPEDELKKMPPMERKKYLVKHAKRYRGKYSDMPDHAYKMLMKYGSNTMKYRAAR